MALRRGAVRGLYLPDGGRVVLHGWKSVALAIGLATAAFCGAALYNGFPLVWPESAYYLGAGNEGIEPPFYGFLTHVLHWRASLWPVVVVQSLMLAHLLWLTCTAWFRVMSRLAYLAIVAVLAAFSSAPWTTGALMPDVFAPALALSLYMLAFYAHALARWERNYLMVLTGIAVSVHASHLLLGMISGALLVGMTWYGGRIRRRTASRFRPGRDEDRVGPTLIRLAVPLVLAGAVVVSNAYLARGERSATLVGQGSAAVANERAAVVAGERSSTLLGDLFPSARLEAEAPVRQLLLVNTGAGLESLINAPEPTDVIQASYPQLMRPYAASRQTHETLELEAIRPAHGMVLWMALAALVVILVVSGLSGRWALVRAGLFFLVYLGLNATITGLLYGLDGRLQSRVVWLVPFYSLAGGWWLAREAWAWRRRSHQRTRP